MTKKNKAKFISLAIMGMIPITINSKPSANFYLSKLNNIDIEYKGAKYLINDDEIQKIIAYSKTYRTFDHKVTDLTVNKLLSLIITNSDEYIKKYPQFNYFINPQDLKSENYQLLKEALINLVNNSTNDLNEDLCTLQNYKFVCGNLNNSVAITNYDLKLVIFDINNLSLDEKKNAITHELNHIKQFICPHREKNGQKNTTIKVDNTLNYLLESSAESAKLNYYKPDYLGLEDYEYWTYSTERNEEQFIQMLSLPENKNIKDYYNAIFDTNLTKLYQYLGLKSFADIKLFYQLSDVFAGYVNEGSIMQKYDDTINKYSKNDIRAIIGSEIFADVYRFCLKKLINYSYEHPDFDAVQSKTYQVYLKEKILSKAGYFNQVNKRVYYEKNFRNIINDLDAIYSEFFNNFYQYPKTFDENDEFLDLKVLKPNFNALREIEENDFIYK